MKNYFFFDKTASVRAERNTATPIASEILKKLRGIKPIEKIKKKIDATKKRSPFVSLSRRFQFKRTIIYANGAKQKAIIKKGISFKYQGNSFSLISRKTLLRNFLKITFMLFRL